MAAVTGRRNCAGWQVRACLAHAHAIGNHEVSGACGADGDAVDAGDAEEVCRGDVGAVVCGEGGDVAAVALVVGEKGWIDGAGLCGNGCASDAVALYDDADVAG